LRRALETLASGGVVAAATESFFGLLCDIGDAGAVERLLSLKPRGSDKGIPVLLPALDHWGALTAELDAEALRVGSAFWPGPLSIALPARPEVDRRLCLDGRLAVRVPGPSVAAELVTALGRPLSATSANPSGMAPATTSEVVERLFLPRPWLHVEPGNAPGGAPSTVLVREGAGWRIARQGAVAAAELRCQLGRALDGPNS
jgi:L-threonylcarbamoyladenylate synthase